MAIPTPKYYFAFGSTWKTGDSSSDLLLLETGGTDNLLLETGDALLLDDATLAWTDVSSYVLANAGTSTNRGRSSELDDFRAGTFSFTLDNSDRRFDPQHATGPYYGNLKPGVPVKIEGTPSGLGVRGVIRGFVDGWPQDYILGNTMATVDVSCTDGFAKLATAKFRQSPYATVLGSLAPFRWFPLSDATSTTSVVDLGTSAQNGSASASGIGFAHTTMDGTLTSATFTGGQITIGDYLTNSSPSGSISFIIKSVTPSGVLYHDGLDSGFRIELDAAGKVKASGSSFTVTSSAAVTDGVAHHVVVSKSTSKGIWVDGVFTAEGVSGPTAFATNEGARIGAPPGSSGLSAFTGDLQHFAFHTTELTSAQVADLYAAFLRWSGDTGSARITRVLDLVGWPTGLRTLATGITSLGPPSTDKSALAVLKDMERTEQGRLFVGRDGKVVFRDRYYAQTVTEGMTSQATFSDDGADIAYSGLGFDFDDRLVFGRAQGNRVGGQTIVVDAGTDSEDTDSSLTDLQLTTDAQVRSLLEYRLGRYGASALRARPIEVKLHGLTAAQQATMLDLELGYRVTAERTPQGVGSQISQATLIEGISHRITGDEWVMTLRLSPVDTRVYWKWGTHKWGTDARWGY